MTYWHANSLEGAAIIVTGAARGVGRGITRALLQRGASVLLVDRARAHLQETAEEFQRTGLNAHQLACDISVKGSARRTVDTALEKLGTVTGLVNNAIACNEPKSFVKISDEDFDLVFDVGPKATFQMMRAVQPVMVAEGGGSIVNIGSGSGTLGIPKFGAYASAKEAQRGMAKVAAMEWAEHQIRVNTVCPFAESDGTLLWREVAPRDYERSIAEVPLGRIGDPVGDVGALVAFLLSDDASFITAQTIHVDGGSGSFR